MTLRTLLFLLLSFPFTMSGQNSDQLSDIQLGAVWFKTKSTKLTKESKAILDTLIGKIQNNPTMQVQAVSFNKDFCDKCGVRSWKRATAVLAYLSKHGVADERLAFSNRLEGELNKVDLFLTAMATRDTPPPGIRNKTNDRQ